jgi:hypothetical protein
VCWCHRRTGSFFLQSCLFLSPRSILTAPALQDIGINGWIMGDTFLKNVYSVFDLQKCVAFPPFHSSFRFYANLNSLFHLSNRVGFANQKQA